MPDPITHATSPWLVASLSAVVSTLFDLPLGVVITAFGGAYWAVYRNSSLRVSRSIFLILFSTFIACVMVHGIVWIFQAWLDISNVPQRPVAFILGFAVIDKPFRDWLIQLIASKYNLLEVKK
jgi:vancomycin permeability regulator SanA